MVRLDHKTGFGTDYKAGLGGGGDHKMVGDDRKVMDG